jgi:hypothetical protein
MLLAWSAASWGAAGPTRQSQARPDTIRTEFRVFHGTAEVTAEIRLRIRPSGSDEAGRLVEGPSLAVDLPVGLYDVQAVRQRAGQVVNVRWAEKLHVMAYPDEGGRHLEVINFADGYGALQLRWPDGRSPDPSGLAVTATHADQARAVPARVVRGRGYALLVLPAGAYDLRIAQPGREPVALSRIEIPPGRTRMTVIR